MAQALERADFKRLAEVFSDHPDFRTEDRRWGLIDEAFRGIDRGCSARAGLDLRDPPRSASVALISRLLDFGCLGTRHSLALVLEVVRDRGGDDRRLEFDRLIAILDAQCQMADSIVRSPPQRCRPAPLGPPLRHPNGRRKLLQPDRSGPQERVGLPKARWAHLLRRPSHLLHSWGIRRSSSISHAVQG